MSLTVKQICELPCYFHPRNHTCAVVVGVDLASKQMICEDVDSGEQFRATHTQILRRGYIFDGNAYKWSPEDEAKERIVEFYKML